MSAPQQPASTARRLPLGEQPVQANTQVQLTDLSGRMRFGCKGPGAPAWLAAGQFSVPREPNSATLDADGVLVARLATSEFLIEAVDAGLERVAATARQLYASAPAGVYAVTRQDQVIGIEGAGSNTLLRQICSVDFAALLEHEPADSDPVVLTSMIGVSVVAWPRRKPSGPSLTLWMDPSFAHYFWTTLLEVGRGVGGAFK